MKISIRGGEYLFTVSCIVFFYCACCPTYDYPNDSRILDVKYIPQKQQYWCWAASSEMILKYLLPDNDTSHKQCRQARICLIDTLDNCKCCTYPINDTCNFPHWPIFDQLGFRAFNTDDHPIYLTWQNMLHEIDNNRPLCLTYNWTGGGAHMIILNGYQIVDRQLWDFVMDPYPGFLQLNNSDENYPYPPVRIVRHQHNRSDARHTLGRCYFNIEKATTY
ncbi:MAG: C39 family peptidase [Saprospiraceae bacterium]|nr:C39 family peptidase [Saprospiraceae bacterium]HMW39694.1 papain-like cysteine protease family protein [Saprospiraceae bacterium]HMX88837.1 papain-like cysteine protease family protein [Saprospiraceae bacterium]HMZ39299.1 papain-like cysteine protease family protein [Saprospiraceae bacterium]HNA65447.1 papain-like cysteine protease family protein [Saprospiraceae bacterium]